MNKKSLSQSVLQSIKNENIKPRSAWHYRVKEFIFWLIFVVSLVIGSQAVSVILHAFFHTDFDVFQLIPQNNWAAFLRILPVYWFALLIFFLGLALWGFRHTKKGYRFFTIWFVSGNIFLSFLIGGGVYMMGGSEKMEQLFADTISFYEPFELRRQYIWNHADKGLLAGMVQKVLPDNTFLLSDFGRNMWVVKKSNVNDPIIFLLRKGMKVKVVGVKEDNGVFQATHIREWKKPHYLKIHYYTHPRSFQ